MTAGHNIISDRRVTLKKGDIVGLLHEKDKGEVVKIISATRVLLKNYDGFESNVHIREIYLIQKDENPDLGIRNMGLGIKKNEKDSSVKKIPKKQNKNPDKRMQYIHDEVDLHIYNLVNDLRGLSNLEMLNIQLRHFKLSLKNAVNNGTKRIVFIHGEGKGVLRNEMIRLLHKFDNVRFQDAPYAYYGHGATEVLILKE